MSRHVTPCVMSAQLHAHLSDYERMKDADAEHARICAEQRPAARAKLLRCPAVLYSAMESSNVYPAMIAALSAGDQTECGRIVRAQLVKHVDSLLEDVEYGINPTSATPDELVREWGTA